MPKRNIIQIQLPPEQPDCCAAQSIRGSDRVTADGIPGCNFHSANSEWAPRPTTTAAYPMNAPFNCKSNFTNKQWQRTTPKNM